MIRLSFFAAGLLLAVTGAAIYDSQFRDGAEAADAQPAADLDTTYLFQTYPGVDKDAIYASESPELYEVRQGGAYGYVTKDGRYLVQGDLIDLTTGVSLTEARRDTYRRDIIKAIGTDSMWVFPPEGETKHVVYVFTDTTCGYCQKMHRELEQYQDQGIEVRYLLYPRSGPDTPSWQVAESAWCADDRNAALTAAKARRKIPTKRCENPVMQHYVAGQAAGLRGTPMLVLEDGTSISGYLPANALLQRIIANKS